MTRGAALVATLAATAMLLSGLAGCGATAPDRQAAQVSVPEPEVAAFVAGQDLHLPDRPAPLRLAAPVSSPLNGWFTPLAVPSPDGRSVVYHTWTAGPDGSGRPALRRVSLPGGEEVVLADGAASLAWGAPGLAYVAGDDHTPEEGWTGQVLVRSAPDAPARAWTTDRRHFAVFGWAGPVLLGYDLTNPGRPELIAFDGPGRRRALGPGLLVALSPDGERAFVVDTRDTVEDGKPASVRVVAVRTGATQARLDLATAGVEAVGHTGDWVGDRVVAPAHPQPVVFSVTGSTIAVAQRIEMGGFPYGLREPRLGITSVTAWAVRDTDPDGPVAKLTCAVGQPRPTGCTAGASFPGPAVHPATNPSRPLTPHPPHG